MDEELEKTELERKERREKHLKAVGLIEDLIQGTLFKHTADTIAKPDFAMYSAGARVITKLTSPSYLPQTGSFLGKLAQVFGINTRKNGNPPAIAMDPDTHLGRCWAFPGSQGQLTIQLSRTINATDFTIEHVDQQVAIDLRSAPKNIEVYGFIHEPTDSVEDDLEEYNRFLLGRFEFDPKEHPIQTFSAISERQVKYVQLRVLSNHGHPDFTCIYRFRVHGKLNEED
ncbi:hypothetical protein K493DRAFT_220191 [Basidiobolus meristosporus CBS 931.73]|uniref:SUN domain-containing protein n=1 Tax=Basidiobolus meristosporus CBS 931.73 TaxID=1314790 RepID=A0A1Y1YAC7_9FUNG|nr:hypothetical protein K493DRAFT_220191 [Basidiobolus meristosporus CBS 931.73]|eukprot:ORX94979.1 hypothetical protein K493DRAFT_220191 [Basidiobolus meristosporus CBS 931.73]